MKFPICDGCKKEIRCFYYEWGPDYRYHVGCAPNLPMPANYHRVHERIFVSEVTVKFVSLRNPFERLDFLNSLSPEFLVSIFNEVFPKAPVVSLEKVALDLCLFELVELRK